MRIAINAVSAAPGGGLTNILGLLEGWSRAGSPDEITVFASHPAVLSHTRTCGGTAVPVSPDSGARRLSWEMSRMPSLLKRHGAEVLLSMNYAAVSVAIPQVVQHQSLTTFVALDCASASARARRFLQRRAARITLRIAAANIFISEYLRRHAEEAVPASSARNHVVPYGLSRRLLECLDTARAPKASTFCIAALQSPAEYKDNESLLQALRILVYTRPGEPWRLRMAGGFDCGRWQERARELGVLERVSWEGFLSEADVVRLLSTSDCLVFPSVFEAFGLPVVEGMACGCPVIAVNATAVPEIAQGAAVLVPARSPEAIADAVLQLHLNGARRDQLVDLGRARARELSWMRTAGRFSQIFREVGGRSAVLAAEASRMAPLPTSTDPAFDRPVSGLHEGPSEITARRFIW